MRDSTIEGHVLLGNDNTNDALLTVTGRELVAELRAPRLTQERLDDHLVVLASRDQYFVHNGWIL